MIPSLAPAVNPEWRSFDETPTDERSWREAIVLEVAQRMANPSLLEILDLTQVLHPKLASEIYSEATDAVILAMVSALKVAEVLRSMPATPESTDSAEDHLKAIVAKAFITQEGKPQTEHIQYATDPGLIIQIEDDLDMLSRVLTESTEARTACA